MALLGGHIASFTTIFLGVFIEAMPFLLLGTLLSGLVEVFIGREQVLQFIPRNPFLATLVGGLLGFAFPVGEGGVVPLTRCLLRKGLPVSAGMAFLLAGPILNPVALATTLVAYGWGPILWARLGFGFLIAYSIGLLFSLSPPTMPVLSSAHSLSLLANSDETMSSSIPSTLKGKGEIALRIAGDEFFEMGRYLVAGCLLATFIQMLVPTSTILAIGSGPLLSVLATQVLAVVLSIASTSDAFVSLTFPRVFTTGSVLSFLVLGPMVDIKNVWMLLGVFQKRVVGYLIVLIFLMTLLMGVFINLNTAW